jgi:pentatricopeptide repeat protein
MKCLEKDRNRRYETPSSLARDVERYLVDEPVQACPPSATYRFRKFARRNRGPVLAAVLVGVALVGGVITSTWQAVRATRAERDAVANANRASAAAEAERTAKEAERNAKEAESSQRRQAEEVSNYLVSAFSSPDPARDGSTVTIAEVLDRALRELQDGLQNDPGTKAALLVVIGRTYLQLGLYRNAIPPLEQARALRDSMPSVDEVQKIWGLTCLADAYGKAGRSDKALALFEQTLELSKEKLGPDHASTLLAVANVAAAYASARRLDDAIALLEETTKELKTKHGLDHPYTISSMGKLASAYESVGQLDKALRLYEETLRLQRTKLGANHPDTLSLSHNLAVAYYSASRWNEALTLQEEILRQQQKTLGPSHPATLMSMNNLASTYVQLGRLDEATQLHESAFGHFKAQLGHDHPDTLLAMFNLAADYKDVGDLDKAIALYEELLELQKTSLGTDHADTQATISKLLEAYVTAGRLGDAVASEDAVKCLTDLLQPADGNSPTSAGLLRSRGDLLARAGRWQDAAADFATLIDLEPENHEVYHSLAPLLVQSGDLEAYQRHCAKMLEQFAKTDDSLVAERMAKDCLILPSSEVDLDAVGKLVDFAYAADDSHWAWIYFQFVKGLCDYRQGRFADSAQLMQKVLSRPREFLWRDAQAYLVLAMAHHQLGQTDKAGIALAEASKIIDANVPRHGSGALDDGWTDWIIAQALLREAQTLIDSSVDKDSS